MTEPSTIALVVAATAAHFGTPTILDRDRHKSVALARQVAIYICRTYVRPTPSYPELGRWFGGRDHTTIMAAVRRIERRYPELENAIRAIRAEVTRSMSNVIRLSDRRKISHVEDEGCGERNGAFSIALVDGGESPLDGHPVDQRSGLRACTVSGCGEASQPPAATARVGARSGNDADAFVPSPGQCATATVVR